MSKKFKKNFLALAILICFAGVISSCYYDYGIDPNDSGIVGTLYNNQYNFAAVTKYYLSDTVYHADGTTNGTYDAQILSQMESKLNNLGWTRVNQQTGEGVVVVTAAVTSGVTYVGGGYDYYGWYGYSWYYPPYYSYSYSYQTGTLAMAISDYNIAESGKVAVQWTGLCNSAINQGTSTSTLITQGINQAFSQAQSPYLYQ